MGRLIATMKMQPLMMAFVVLCTSSVQSQDLLPEIAPHAVRYNEATTKLAEQKVAALSNARETYLTALAAAETKATSAGQLPVIAAITKESESISKGNITVEFPKELPKTLQSSRKSYLDAFRRVSVDFAGRQQKISADYLRSLAALQKNDRNPKLAEQIALQKKAILNNPATGALTIIQAVYQGKGGEKPKDVTERLKKLLESGALTTKCTPGDMGNDPAPGKGKTLIVDYTIRGAVKQKKFGDLDVLNFHDHLK